MDVRSAATILPNTKPPIYITSLANALTVKMGLGHSGDFSDGGLEDYMYESLGLKQTDLDAICKQTQEEMKKAGSFLTANL